jgi:serine/threonine protein kinase
MGLSVLPSVESSKPDIESERAGIMIGRYKLLEKIGEGGFGAVFMAEQIEPIHRNVALKIIKAGMDTKEVIARFETERQAIALMDHPNIARALDAGATETGRPYFVMELVRGIPITDYCDQNHLSTSVRLQLFIKVCQAVEHAHQKGVIHRDLKPGNVLVTLHDGEPVPKVIDFGVAKALGQKLTEKTLFTAFHHLIGTPAYMSPEQAALSGLEVDTRVDIYSLGVLLYELLTGATPFEPEAFRKAGIDEIRRMIQETEPPKPSTRLQTLGQKLPEVARQRQTEPATLSRLVRGDLDWIVMKCLEKDRQRRYETAHGLATDVARHLNSEPVVARPPSNLYRLQKLFRRQKVAIGAAAAVVAALAIGLSASRWYGKEKPTAAIVPPQAAPEIREVTINGVTGYEGTPMQPDGKWHVHDPERPQPRVMMPATFSTQEQSGTPPADAIILFDGQDLSRWRHKDGQTASWLVQNGAMISTSSDIVSTQKFGDIQLHLEFSEPVPATGNGQRRGNSGVLFMDKYEVQILDCYQNKTYADGTTGGLYGQYPPLANVSLPPGQWQVYDILFNAPRFAGNGNVVSPAYVTVFLNGVVVQNHQAYNGSTGHKSPGKYSPHDPIGPICLQFNNNSPVRFRNIWVRSLE